MHITAANQISAAAKTTIVHQRVLEDEEWREQAGGEGALVAGRHLCEQRAALLIEIE